MNPPKVLLQWSKNDLLLFLNSTEIIILLLFFNISIFLHSTNSFRGKVGSVPEPPVESGRNSSRPQPQQFDPPSAPPPPNHVVFQPPPEERVHVQPSTAVMAESRDYSEAPPRSDFDGSKSIVIALYDHVVSATLYLSTSCTLIALSFLSITCLIPH